MTECHKRAALSWFLHNNRHFTTANMADDAGPASAAAAAAASIPHFLPVFGNLPVHSKRQQRELQHNISWLARTPTSWQHDGETNPTVSLFVVWPEETQRPLTLKLHAVQFEGDAGSNNNNNNNSSSSSSNSNNNAADGGDVPPLTTVVSDDLTRQLSSLSDDSTDDAFAQIGRQMSLPVYMLHQQPQQQQHPNQSLARGGAHLASVAEGSNNDNDDTDGSALWAFNIPITTTTTTATSSSSSSGESAGELRCVAPRLWHIKLPVPLCGTRQQGTEPCAQWTASASSLRRANAGVLSLQLKADVQDKQLRHRLEREQVCCHER